MDLFIFYIIFNKNMLEYETYSELFRCLLSSHMLHIYTKILYVLHIFCA